MADLNMVAATVTIPPDAPLAPSRCRACWKLEREAPTPSKRFVLKPAVPLVADAARKEMAEKLKGMSSKALLIFVHGYNSSFAEAALRTAQMAHDLEFPGMAVFLQLALGRRGRRHWQDEETARLSESVFEHLIEEVSRLPVTDIYLVAHSMGNRIVGMRCRARIGQGEGRRAASARSCSRLRTSTPTVPHGHRPEAGRHAGTRGRRSTPHRPTLR